MKAVDESEHSQWSQQADVLFLINNSLDQDLPDNLLFQPTAILLKLRAHDPRINGIRQTDW